MWVQFTTKFDKIPRYFVRKGVIVMPFCLPDDFDEKYVQKAFQILRRMKISYPSESDAQCILCRDHAIASDELIVCTDRSVFYLPYLSSGFEQYDFSTISAVTIASVKFVPSVCLTISNGNSAKLYVPSDDAEKMAEYIKGKISVASPPPVFSPADEILKYKNLLDIGAITSEEYEAKKKQLLAL